MPTWIISLVVSFIVKQIAKYGAGLDWNKVKADIDAQIRAALPGWLEQAAVDVANKVIDLVAAALADAADLQAIADKLVAGDVGGAIADLKALVIKLIHPDTALKGAVVDACEDCAA